MQDYKTEIEIDGIKYPVAFTLNVMASIQEKYETFNKWAELTDGASGEVNIKAIIYGLTCMINEGIDIENEEKGEKRPMVKEKQVGRIMTKLGIAETTKTLNDVVINSTKSDEKN